MKQTTIMIAGGAVAAGGLAYYYWRRARAAKHQAVVDTVRSRGKDQTLRSTDGMKLVPIAGGSGAGAGRPLDTSTRIHVVGKVAFYESTDPRGRPSNRKG
jgi:hypothetical protein